MLRRSFLTIGTMIGLSAVYGLYARFVGKLVRPQPAFLQAHQALANRGQVQGPPADNVQVARRFLPDWAADATYQLRDSGNVFYYTQQWERIDASQGESIRFTPFALVWFRQDEAPGQAAQSATTSEPLILLADSALIQFDSKFDMAHPQFGRVVGGQLEGSVEIRGENDLVIQGRNLIFRENARRIWSDNAVAFRYGPHKGTADRGIQIDLIPSPEPGDSTLAFLGMRTIHLRRRVHMNFVMEEGNTAIPVTIDCDGGFTYELTSLVARFEENVRVKRQTATATYDTLDCTRLTLNLEQLAERDLEASRHTGPSGLPAHVAFRRLLAEGRRVVLKSDANQLVAHMSEFQYNAATRMATLRSNEAVRVWHRSSTLVASDVSATHDERGKIVAARCRGAGRLEHRNPNTSELLFDAEWIEQMNLGPVAESETTLVELQKGAVVRKPDQQMAISANQIRLWYQSSREPVRRVVVADQDAQLGKNQPRYLVATGDVSVLSPQLEGQTMRLQVVFDEQPRLTGSTGTVSNQRDRRRLHPAMRHVALAQNARPTAPPEPEQPAGSGTSLLPVPLSVDENTPVHLVSDSINVRLQPDSGGTDKFQLAEVWNEGRVRISQQGKNGEKSFDLSGAKLHMLNHSDNDQVFHVFGEPARILHAEFQLEGPEVYLDRHQNEAWVHGPGQLSLLVRSGFDGGRFEKPETLTIHWDEKMTFDGLHAEFLGHVQGELEHSRMRCHDMQIELTERVLFARRQTSGLQTQIRTLLCQDGVEVDSYAYEHDKLIEIRKARFGAFSLDHITGVTQATGPGEAHFWRRGSGRRAALSPTAVVQANAPLETETAEWEFARVEFSGNTHGNLHQRQTTFSDRVRVVYGPVAAPRDTINPDQLSKNAAEMQCDILEFAQQPKSESHPQGYIELTARGNAKLEGRTFFARADVISYDESKSLYILTSLGNREATIWRQTHRGGDYSDMSAKRMRFIPSRLEFDRATRLHGMQ